MFSLNSSFKMHSYLTNMIPFNCSLVLGWANCRYNNPKLLNSFVRRKNMPHFCMNCKGIQQTHGKRLSGCWCHNVAWQQSGVFTVPIDTLHQFTHWQVEVVIICAICNQQFQIISLFHKKSERKFYHKNHKTLTWIKSDLNML